VVDFALREDHALTVEHRGEQLHLSAVGASGAAQRLAVDRDRQQLLVTAVAGAGWVCSASQPPSARSSWSGSTDRIARRRVASCGAT
jgi:hypothetical protein